VRIEKYETTGLKRTSLPITGKTSTGTIAPYQNCVAIEVVVPEVIPGDVLEVESTVQVTTEFTWNVMIARYLLVSDVSDNPLVGTRIERPMGENFNNDIHHKMVSADGSFVVPEGWTGPVYVSQVMYTASTAAVAGNTLKVDYGQITVLRNTEAPLPEPV
jgi:hypothetical protein